MLNGEESIADLLADLGIKAGNDNDCQSNNQNDES
jgi:hypothetical protein